VYPALFALPLGATLRGFPFAKVSNFAIMAKAKKKSAKDASSIFHSIMAASVKGNPKPKKAVKKK